MLKTAHKSDTPIKSYGILKIKHFQKNAAEPGLSLRGNRFLAASKITPLVFTMGNRVVPIWEPVPRNPESTPHCFYKGEPVRPTWEPVPTYLYSQFHHFNII